MLKFLKISLLLLIIPSTLMCMLADSQTIKFVTLTKPQENAIEQFYNTAGATLSKFKSTDETSINNLLQFIHNVNTFTTNNAGIDEQYLGSFAHTKEATSTSSFGSSFSSPTQPTRIALFFHLLKKYNNELSVVTKNTPTLTEWQAYQHNKSINIPKILEVAKAFGITLSENFIDKNKPPFIPIAVNVAITPFINFVENIEKMMAEKQLIFLKFTADLIYLNEAIETQQ